MEKKSAPPAIIIGGLTGSGKSSLAFTLAHALSGGIVNADSLQLYQELSVLSAVPPPEDFGEIPHFLYGCLSYQERWSVTDWQEHALILGQYLVERKKIPIFVGGTGFYIETLLKGLSPIPPISPSTRSYVQDLLNTKGLSNLFSLLCEVDPSIAKRLSTNDKQRITRAIEVWHETRKPLSEWQARPAVLQIEFPFSFYKILVCPSLEDLTPYLTKRIERMIENDVFDQVEEVSALSLPSTHPLNKTIGFKEIASYLNGEMLYSDLVPLITLKSRQYAKRQSTWFRNRLDPHLTIRERYHPSQIPQILEEIKAFFPSL